ncbi:MAG: YihY/virulence factor BrkB family protein [Longimicrobiales bacterium]|nr:YihY/virulence factor BrkB family protein [Longimicrobiales bacterium]
MTEDRSGVDEATPADAAASAETAAGGVRRWFKTLGSILKETAVEWLEDGVPARGAALAYYVLLSLGPFLVILVGVLQFFLSEEQVQEGVLRALEANVGGRAAETVGTVMGRVELPNLLSPESILTVALLLFGATAAFTNVRGSLDAIWGVEPEEQSKKEIALDYLRARFQGFIMMLFTGLFLTISFLVTSLTGVMGEWLEAWIPHGAALVQLADAGFSLLIIGLLFAAIYRTLPSVQVEWNTVWVGAFTTALLFVIGKWLVAQLLAHASWTSYYGPGASVVAFLAWIYFSAQIFFLGAEFTQVWSRRRGGVMSQKGQAP